MTRKSKLKKRYVQESQVVVDIPIPNLPKKYLWMHVNSGTKIRNVLNYALKEFPGYKSVLWSGAGQGIGKVITCAELCKRKNPGLHQITKLRYVRSKKAGEMGNDDNTNRRVPEIHILLAKEPLDPCESGYQSSLDKNLFPSRVSQMGISPKISSNKSPDRETLKKDSGQKPSTSKSSNFATEEFAAMGLRTGQKRSHKGHRHTTETSSGNKSKKKG